MLDNAIVKKIEDFVYSNPRSVQEIAAHIGKNWRTADRYVDRIAKEFGTISIKIFRGGTRGALKIVFWSSVEKVSSSIFQEQIEKEIINGKSKEDFSAFDIFQHVPNNSKKAVLEKAEVEDKTNLKELADYLEKAEKQVLLFSGNLSWINLKSKDFDFLSILNKLVKKGVIIKVLSRVDLTSFENTQTLLSLNFKNAKEMIEIRHREQPIRGLIIDNKILRIKEIKEPTGKAHELNKRTFIFYTIRDKSWVEWLSRIFWKMFSCSIDARKRIEELKNLKN